MTAANKTVQNAEPAIKPGPTILIFSMLRNMPYEEVVRPRQTRFRKHGPHAEPHLRYRRRFPAHLQGREHGYSARNTPSHPSLEELWQAVQTLNRW